MNFPSDRVRHKNAPAEPWGVKGQQGTITRVKTDGRLRIAPGMNGSPSLAYVAWSDEKLGEWCTWERVSDLIPQAKAKK